MNRKGETIRTKILRRRILVCLRSALAAGGEGWLSERALFGYLADETDGLSLSEVHEAVRYLEGKDYAATRMRRETKFETGETDARALPKAVDLLEETIPPDPGVEDNRA